MLSSDAAVPIGYLTPPLLYAVGIATAVEQFLLATVASNLPQSETLGAASPGQLERP